MNKSIPIIAIQLNAFAYENMVFLNFVKVLDLSETGEEEEIVSEPEVNRDYWVSRADPASIQLTDSLVQLIKPIAAPRISYTKSHVAVGTTGRNFLWCYPRKGQYLRLRLRVGEDRDVIITKFVEESVECKKGTHAGFIRMALTLKELQENTELIKEALVMAESESH
jgi:hypothetical protein